MSCTDCKLCDLCHRRDKIVYFSGNPKAKAMLIGEAPGADEDREGLPFVGRAGKFLTKMLVEAKIDREKDLYVTNIVKCRPPGNRKPTKKEVLACNIHLEKQLKEINPEIIIPVGATALSYFVNEKITNALGEIVETKITITQARGQIFNYKNNGCNVKLIPIFHPSFLLRDHSENPDSPKGLTKKDLKFIKELLTN